MKYLSIYLFVSLFVISLPAATLAGCQTDIPTVYEIQNVTCSGSQCDNMVVRNDDGGPEDIYYETNNCSACYELDRYGTVTKCTEHPECNLVAINHYASCGGGYQVDFTRASLGESFYGDDKYIETPVYTKADLEKSTHISKQIEDITLEFDLVPTGEIIQNPSNLESFNALPGEYKVYYFIAPAVVLIALAALGVWFFKHKNHKSGLR